MEIVYCEYCAKEIGTAPQKITGFCRNGRCLEMYLAHREAAQQSVKPDGLTICQNCGSWLRAGECENCNSPIAPARR